MFRQNLIHILSVSASINFILTISPLQGKEYLGTEELIRLSLEDLMEV